MFFLLFRIRGSLVSFSISGRDRDPVNRVSMGSGRIEEEAQARGAPDGVACAPSGMKDDPDCFVHYINSNNAP